MFLKELKMQNFKNNNLPKNKYLLSYRYASNTGNKYRLHSVQLQKLILEYIGKFILVG